MQKTAGGRQERSSSGRRPSPPRRRGLGGAWAEPEAGPRRFRGWVCIVTWPQTASALLLLRKPRSDFGET